MHLHLYLNLHLHFCLSVCVSVCVCASVCVCVCLCVCQAGGFINECIEYEHCPVNKNGDPRLTWCKDSFWDEDYGMCLSCALRGGHCIDYLTTVDGRDSECF